MKDFRPNLVNVIVGVSTATVVLFFAIPAIHGNWWEMTLAYLLTIVGAVASGYVTAWGINQAQGQGHQTAASADAEQLRSTIGALATTVVLTPLFSFIDISESTWIWKTGLGVFIVAVIIWGGPALYKKLKVKYATKK